MAGAGLLMLLDDIASLLDDVAFNIMGRTICALGDAAAMPVRAMIKHYRHEFEAKIAAAQTAAKAA